MQEQYILVFFLEPFESKLLIWCRISYEQLSVHAQKTRITHITFLQSKTISQTSLEFQTILEMSGRLSCRLSLSGASSDGEHCRSDASAVPASFKGKDIEEVGVGKGSAEQPGSLRYILP
jgi:hypothetical protein